MPAIHLDNLVKRYGEVEVLHSISLDMADNEFTVLVGPSGCGKSTTLRMIAGLETVSGGEIFVGGEPVSHLEPKERDLAMVFQDYALYPHMNVAQNISFALRLQRRPKSEIDAKVRQVAEMVGLTDFLHRKPGALSGGQRQRVAMARALAKDSGIFLFDEPLSNLDAKLRGQMRAELALMSQRVEKNMIYVTHDQIEAMTLADRVVVMSKGVVQQVGTPTEIYDNPANTFVAGFIGSPAMNLVDGMLENGTFTAEGISISGLPAQHSGNVTLGFRAEDASVAAGTGEVNSKVYSLELLGEATMVTMRAGGTILSVKSGKEYRTGIGDPVSANIPAEICHLFDASTGERF